MDEPRIACRWCGAKKTPEHMYLCQSRRIPDPDAGPVAEKLRAIALPLCFDCMIIHGFLQGYDPEESDGVIENFGGPLAARLRRTIP